MEELNYAKGVAMIRCWYHASNEDRQKYDTVVIITARGYVAISYDSAVNVWRTMQNIVNNYGEPTVLGLNNYLEYSTQNSYNCYLHIDRDSVRFKENDEPIDVKRFFAVLQETISGQVYTECYRDTTDRVELNFATNQYHCFLKKNSELYFTPRVQGNWIYSRDVDSIVSLEEEVRMALRSGRKKVYAEVY